MIGSIGSAISGLTAIQDQVNTSAGKIAEAASPSSDLDLVHEVSELVVANPVYQANLKVVQTQDEMLGSLLNIKR